MGYLSLVNTMRRSGSVEISQEAHSPRAKLAFYKFAEPIECSAPSDLGKGLYTGQAFLCAPLRVWELVGRSFMITSDPLHRPGKGYEICGVLARSAGVWENDKQVCACSGKSVWQERKDALDKNIQH